MKRIESYKYSGQYVITIFPVIASHSRVGILCGHSSVAMFFISFF